MNVLDAMLSRSEATPDNEIIYLCKTPISSDRADFISSAPFLTGKPSTVA